MIAANRPPLTRTVIADAALDLVEKYGFSHLTMRRLGESLEVDAMSLYYHFDNKNDLLDAMLARLFSGIVLPDSSAAGFASWLRAIWRVFDHPAALDLYTERVASSKAGTNGVLWCGVALLEAGLDPVDAAKVYRIMASYITGYAAMRGYIAEIAGSAKGEAGAADPLVREFLDAMVSADDGDSFEVGLEILETALLPDSPAASAGPDRSSPPHLAVVGG